MIEPPKAEAMEPITAALSNSTWVTYSGLCKQVVHVTQLLIWAAVTITREASENTLCVAAYDTLAAKHLLHYSQTDSTGQSPLAPIRVWWVPNTRNKLV